MDRAERLWEASTYSLPDGQTWRCSGYAARAAWLTWRQVVLAVVPRGEGVAINVVTADDEARGCGEAGNLRIASVYAPNFETVCVYVDWGDGHVTWASEQSAPDVAPVDPDWRWPLHHEDDPPVRVSPSGLVERGLP